jgi:hypothetical protein
MATLSKKLMRTLPTLTEVVAAPGTVAVSAAPVAAEPSAFDEEVLIQQVQARLELSLDLRIQHAVDRIVREQLHEMEPQIRARVDAEVREAVAQAISEERRLRSMRKAI